MKTRSDRLILRNNDLKSILSSLLLLKLQSISSSHVKYHFDTEFADSNLDIGEHCENLAEFNIDYGDCYCTLERTKKKGRDGKVLYEAS